MSLVIIAAVVVVGLLLRPLLTIHRSALPTVVRPEDPAEVETAFGAGERLDLAARGFVDEGVTIIEMGGGRALLHLFRRPADGSVVTGLSGLDGDNPAHYVTTMLADGRGWVDSRRTDRTPGPPGEFVQVSPDTTLDELIDDHESALAAVVGHGARPNTEFDAFGVHLHQGRMTRSSVRRNPIRWLIGLARHAGRPDARRDLAADPDLGRRLKAAGLA